MLGKMLNTINESKSTPLSLVLFVVGWISLSIFLVLFFLIDNRNQILDNEYSKLEIEGSSSFSIIKEYHKIFKRNNILHLYTYSILDDMGNFHEITEYVDSKTHSKLRIGDNAMILSKSIYLNGNKLLITRIKGNTAINSQNKFLEVFSIIGVFSSIILLVISGIFILKIIV
jgi:hypothetical protein